MTASLTKQLEVAERRRQAVELKAAGVPLELIARQVPGYPSGQRGVAAVSKDIHRAMTARLTELGRSIDTMREMQDVRLDRLQAALWSTAVSRPAPPAPPVGNEDDREAAWTRYEADLAVWEKAIERQLAAADKVLKVISERSRLHGLYAPTTHHILTMDAVEAEIARLSADLARNDVPRDPDGDVLAEDLPT